MTEDEWIGSVEEPEVDLAFNYSRSTEGLCVLNELTARPVPAAVPVIVADASPAVASPTIVNPPDEFDYFTEFGVEPDADFIVDPPVLSVSETVSPSPVDASSSVDAPFARAVRLTREAALAWASVLAGPTVVTSTH